jgi:hypothetical protein
MGHDTRPTTARQVVQIAFGSGDAESGCLIALCSDGSIWSLPALSRQWRKLPAIPQS